jgi:hypothetical protein
MIARRGMADEIAAALAANGLILRGGFSFAAGEEAPSGLSGATARSVLLVGQAGAAPWPHFLRWRERQVQATANPLDTWSREVIGAVAKDFGARAVSPSDKPYLPFQQWAMRAEGLKPSPLGILMHPQYGLWHAYRGALLFAEPLGLARPAAAAHLCDACPDKPCRSGCPAAAHAAPQFDHAGCLAHVRAEGGSVCRLDGCADRNACPHGLAFRYPAEVQAFHMAAFAGVELEDPRRNHAV